MAHLPRPCLWSQMANLRKTNLNLLPLLRELLRHRNVTNAALALNLTQPAVSKAQAQLRHLLHDEILILNGRSLQPSAFAEIVRRIGCLRASSTASSRAASARSFSCSAPNPIRRLSSRREQDRNTDGAHILAAFDCSEWVKNDSTASLRCCRGLARTQRIIRGFFGA
jgi:hypothetical protein